MMSKWSHIFILLLIRLSNGEGGCPSLPDDGFTGPSDSGKYFRLVTKELPFLSAREECKKVGGHDLVVFNTDEEMQKVKDLSKQMGVTLFHVGLVSLTGKFCNDEQCSGHWRWLDGEMVSESYVSKAFGRQSFERCVWGRWKVGDQGNLKSFRLGDIDCSRNLSSMCQFDCTKQPPPEELEPWVQRFGKKLVVKITHDTTEDYYTTLPESNSSDVGNLIEPRDLEIAPDIHQFLAVVSGSEVLMGLISHSVSNCSDNCDGHLTFMSDGSAFQPQPQYSVGPLVGGQGLVVAQFNILSNVIELRSASNLNETSVICQKQFFITLMHLAIPHSDYIIHSLKNNFARKGIGASNYPSPELKKPMDECMTVVLAHKGEADSREKYRGSSICPSIAAS